MFFGILIHMLYTKTEDGNEGYFDVKPYLESEAFFEE